MLNALPLNETCLTKGTVEVIDLKWQEMWLTQTAIIQNVF